MTWSNSPPALFHRWTLCGSQCHQQSSLYHTSKSHPPTTALSDTCTHKTLFSIFTHCPVYQLHKSPLTTNESPPKRVNVYMFVHMTDILIDWITIDCMTWPAGSLDLWPADGIYAAGGLHSAASLRIENSSSSRWPYSLSVLPYKSKCFLYCLLRWKKL